jgi:hypothetical protein
MTVGILVGHLGYEGWPLSGFRGVGGGEGGGGGGGGGEGGEGGGSIPIPNGDRLPTADEVAHARTASYGQTATGVVGGGGGVWRRGGRHSLIPGGNPAVEAAVTARSGLPPGMTRQLTRPEEEDLMARARQLHRIAVQEAQENWDSEAEADDDEVGLYELNPA